MRIPKLIAGLAFLVCGTLPVQAASWGWTGGSLLTNNWSDFGNWSPLGIPANGDLVYMYSSGYAISNLDFSISLTGLVFANSSAFTLSSTNGSTVAMGAGDYIYNAGTGNTTITVGILGVGGVVQNGTGNSLTLTALTPGQNTFSGLTQVYNGGSLADGAPYSFSAYSPVWLGSSGTGTGTLDVNYNEQIGGLVDGGSIVGTVNIASGANLNVGGSASNTFSGTITGAGTLESSALATMTLAGNSTAFTGNLIIDAGSTVQFGNGGTAGTLTAGTVSGAGDLSFNRTDAALTFAGTIMGSIEVVQNGTGSTTLSGPNSYSGRTVVNSGGTLVAGSAGAFGGPTGLSEVVLNNGTLSLGGYTLAVGALAGSANGAVQLGSATLSLDDTEANTNFAGALHGTGQLMSSQYILSLTGTGSDYSGQTTVVAGTLLADNPSGSATGTGNVHISSGSTLQIGNVDANGYLSAGAGIYNYGTLTFATTRDLAFPNMVVGTGGLDKYETNTLTLAATSYSGATTINAGTVTDANDNALSSTSDFTIDQYGILSVAFNEVIGSLQDTLNAGAVNIAAGKTLTSNGQNYTTDFSGPISGLGEFAVAAGVQGLSGNNTYSGGTLISGTGELFVGSNTALGTGVVEFNGSGTEMSPDANVTLANNFILLSTFDNDDGGNYNMTLTGQISGPGEIEWCAPGTLTLVGNNYFSGGVLLREGAVVLLNNTGAGTGGITMESGTTLVVGTGITVTNPLSFTGSAETLAGSGTLATPVTASNGVNLAGSVGLGGGPGTLTFASGLTLDNGGAITLRLYDANGTAGTGYSLVSATGGLDIAATAGGFMVNVTSIDAAGNSAAAINFNPYSPYSWKFATSTTAITNFSAAAFTVTNGLLNSTAGGTFSVSEIGNDLFVDFSPVPEPATWALLLAGTAGLGAVGLRQRRRLTAVRN